MSDSIIKGFVGIDKIRSDEEMKKLVDDAAKENHGVFMPTHALRQEDKLVGYWSVGGACLNWCWFSAQIHARESLHVINSMEWEMRRNGVLTAVHPIKPGTPFHPLMGHLGYTNLGSFDMFAKKL